MGKVVRSVALGGCWASLVALSPAPARLPYDLNGMAEWPQPTSPGTTTATPEPPAGGSRLPYELGGLLDDPPAPPPPARERRSPPSPRLLAEAAVDVGVTADSNINNATDLPAILVDYGDGAVPVPLGAASRRHAGIGLSVTASASADLHVGGRLSLAADAEAYLVDQEGGGSDDGSVLLAAGPELALNGGGSASVQLFGFGRWYGGIVASEGVGARGALHLPLQPGQNLHLLTEARTFESDYGSDFDGSLASVTLSYDAALASDLSASAGVYARRYRLESASFSNREVGIYGGLSRYFGPDVTGALSVGLSRAVFDAPVPWLSSEAREDWRIYAILSARARRPLLRLLYPNLSYTYGRTDSSILFYDADRHVLRLGMTAPF